MFDEHLPILEFLPPLGARQRLLGLIAVAVLLAAGCDIPPTFVEEAPATPSASEIPIAVARGAVAYRQACQTCHGARGDGNGPRVTRLDPRPLDFTRGVYKCRSTASGVLPLDRDLFETISLGVPGTSMPAFDGLFSAEARMDLVLYIQRFSRRFGKEPIDPRDILEIPAEPQAAATSTARGSEVYGMRCVKCHGKEGRGDGSAAAGLKDGWGRPIRPTDLGRGGFRWGSDGFDIYRSIFTGLDGTPMRSYADAVEAGDRWPLVHFVQSLVRPPTTAERLFHRLPE